ANTPPKVLRKDHVAYHPSQSTIGGKSLAAMEIEADSTGFIPMTQETHVNVKSMSDLDPLSYARPRSILEQDIAQSSRRTPVMKDPDSEKSTSFTSMVGSPGIPPGYFSKLRHLPNDDFLSQYNINLARQVAMGSQLRGLLEAKADMKGVAKAKNVELSKELESLRVQFSYPQVSNNQLSQQMSTLLAQILGEERLKAAFEEFKKYEDDRVNSRCAEMNARLDALSIDFDEDIYPHMLTAIAGHRWVIRHGLRLAVMKCAKSTELRQVFADVVSAGIAKGISEGVKHGVEHEKAKVDLAAIEAYDPEADTKYVAAFHALKDLNSSQLKILVDREVRNPKDHWSFKEETLLEDAIAANIIAPQGLAILLADADTQTERTEDEASSRLLESKSLPPMYNLDWPRRKRGNKGAKANAPPNVLRKDHVASRPSHSTLRGKSLATIEIVANSTGFVPTTQETPVNVSDPDPLSYAEPRPITKQDIS
nr:hypothetical protein [Tanacetum cinerariifolium]